MLYLSQGMPSSAVFFIHTSSGGALSGILYFEFLLSCIILYCGSNSSNALNCKWSGQVSDGFFE